MRISTRRRRLAGAVVLGIFGALAAACTGGPGQAADKHEILSSGKADGVDALCTKYGLPLGCDLCEHFGWYGDGECDAWLISEKICKFPDPDCASTPSKDAGIDEDRRGDVWRSGREGGWRHEGGSPSLDRGVSTDDRWAPWYSDYRHSDLSPRFDR